MVAVTTVSKLWQVCFVLVSILVAQAPAAQASPQASPKKADSQYETIGFSFPDKPGLGSISLRLPDDKKYVDKLDEHTTHLVPLALARGRFRQRVKKGDRLEFVVGPKLITGKSMPVIAQLKSLDTLDLGSLSLGNVDLSPLCSLPNLTSLLINEAGLTDKNIAQLKGCPKLQCLQIMKNPGLTDACVRELASYKSLCIVLMSGTSITPSALTKMPKIAHVQVDSGLCKGLSLADVRKKYPNIVLDFTREVEKNAKPSADEMMLFAPTRY